MKKIKILMYTTIFSNGGAERTILNIVNNINLKKYDVILVVGRKNGIDYLKQLKKDKSIKYINLNSADDKDYEIPDLLAPVIEKEKPDICFAPGIFTNFILMDAIEKIDYKGKIVLRESGYVSSRNLSEDAKNKLTNQYKKSDAIISIAKGMKKDLFKNYNLDKNKITIIGNPIDRDGINKKANEKTNDKIFNNINTKKIITVGRLEEVKNQKMLLNTFKRVKEKYSDVSLIILGQGSLENKLKKLSKDLKIQDSVYFLGFKENPYYYIKNSDMFILTSLTEGFSHVILESLVLKTPVISTKCPTGPEEVLKNGKYGYLVKVNDEKNLEKKILKLLKNINVSKRKVNKAYLGSKEYSLEVIIKKYEELFEKIINQ